MYLMMSFLFASSSLCPPAGSSLLRLESHLLLQKSPASLTWILCCCKIQMSGYTNWQKESLSACAMNGTGKGASRKNGSGGRGKKGGPAKTAAVHQASPRVNGRKSSLFHKKDSFMKIHMKKRS